MPGIGEWVKDDKVSVLDCNHKSITTSDAFYPDGVSPQGVDEALAGKTTDDRVGGHYWRVYTVPIRPLGGNRPVGAVQFFRVVDNQVHELNHLGQVLIGGGIASLIIAGIAGFFLRGPHALPHQNRIRGSAKVYCGRITRAADATHPHPQQRRDGVDVREQPGTRRCRRLLQDIVTEVDRMSTLVTDLLTLARVDNSRSCSTWIR